MLARLFEGNGAAMPRTIRWCNCYKPKQNVELKQNQYICTKKDNETK